MASQPQANHITTLLTSPLLPIHLRPLLPSDAAAFARLVSDPRAASDPAVRPIDASTARDVISRMRDSASKPTMLDPSGTGVVVSGPDRVNLAVVLDNEKEEQVIGLGGYGAIKTREGGRRVGDVGVLIDPAFRGKGYATEALRLAIDWGFAGVEEGGLQLDLVSITTLSDNEPVVRLVRDKLGVRVEPVEREVEGGKGDKREIYWELRKQDWVCERSER